MTDATERMREKAIKIAANTNFSDWAKDRLATDIEAALLEARDEALEEFQSFAEDHYWDSLDPTIALDHISAMIRSLKSKGAGK